MVMQPALKISTIAMVVRVETEIDHRPAGRWSFHETIDSVDRVRELVPDHRGRAAEFAADERQRVIDRIGNGAGVLLPA